MRLLLDESVPRRLGRSLTGHFVRTVGEMGWGGIKNGRLLALAAAEFDAFLTVDKNLPYQQNLTTLALAVVVLDATSNELPSLLPLMPALENTLANLEPRRCVKVGGAPQGYTRRRIVGFHQDDESHWVAELDCGHRQHVRHDPPWQNRPWVTTPEGRARTLGAVLPCRKCDIGAPPDL